MVAKNEAIKEGLEALSTACQTPFPCFENGWTCQVLLYKVLKFVEKILILLLLGSFELS